MLIWHQPTVSRREIGTSTQRSCKYVVGAFNQEKAQGLVHDYEPSDGPFSSSILHSHRTLMTPRSASRRARRRLRSWRWSTTRWTRRPRIWSPTSGSPGQRSSPSSSGKSRPKTFTVFQPNYKFVCTLCKYNYQKNYCKVQNCVRNVSAQPGIIAHVMT